jgi:hypothetical protein
MANYDKPKFDMEPEENNEQGFILAAKERAKAAVQFDSHNRIAAVEILEMLENLNHWDATEARRRERMGRPMMNINVLPKYTEQVCGEIRKNKMQIKVKPGNSKADMNISKIREGMIYDIEYSSEAESIYDYVGQCLVEGGYGAYRARTRYTEDNPFLQEVYFERIENPLSVYVDPNAQNLDFSDAEYVFVFRDVTHDDFKKAYGKEVFEAGGFDTEEDISRDKSWRTEDTITIAEYYYKEKTKVKKVMLSDNQIMDKDEAEEYIGRLKATFDQKRAEIEAIKDEQEKAQALAGFNPDYIPEIIHEREVEQVKIKWCEMTGSKVLDKKDVPGKFIPVIFGIGKQRNISGKRYIQGLVNNAADSQRMFDYWHTAAAEMIALQPKAPYLMTPEMVAGHEEQWAKANEDNMPYLLFTPDSKMPGMIPQRNSASFKNPEIFTQIDKAKQNVSDSIGMYAADVGDQGRELSGEAIYARQQPGDTATFVFPDNLRRMVAYGGKVVNSMLDDIYDSERDVRIRNFGDESESFVPINTTVSNALDMVSNDPVKYQGMDVDKLKQDLEKYGPTADFNNISNGKYSVYVATGPSFTTQRAEAADAMMKIATASATMRPEDKYYLVKNLDFPGSDEYAEVIRKTVPHNLLPKRPGDPPPPPPPLPDPRIEVEKAKLEVQKIDRLVQLEKMQTEKLRQKTQIMDMITKLKESDTKLKQELLTVLERLRQEEESLNQKQVQMSGGQAGFQ